MLLSVAVALRGAAALEPVTCSGGDEQQTNAVRFALHHINQNQDHGYKFKLSEVLANNVVPVCGYPPPPHNTFGEKVDIDIM